MYLKVHLHYGEKRYKLAGFKEQKNILLLQNTVSNRDFRHSVITTVGIFRRKNSTNLTTPVKLIRLPIRELRKN